MQGTAVVIGAGPGLGAAVARRFAAGGMTVHVANRSGSLPAGLSEDAATPHRVDAADHRAVEELVERLGDDLRAVVVNVMAQVPGSPTEVDLDTLLDTLRVNALAPLAAARAAARHMPDAGGSFLLTGGGIVDHPRADVTALSLGKTATRVLTTLLGQDLGPRGVHVASVVVTGRVEPGSAFDPDDIAEHFWALHTQAPEQWRAEVVH